MFRMKGSDRVKLGERVHLNRAWSPFSSIHIISIGPRVFTTGSSNAIGHTNRYQLVARYLDTHSEEELQYHGRCERTAATFPRGTVNAANHSGPASAICLYAHRLNAG